MPKSINTVQEPTTKPSQPPRESRHGTSNSPRGIGRSPEAKGRSLFSKCSRSESRSIRSFSRYWADATRLSANATTRRLSRATRFRRSREVNKGTSTNRFLTHWWSRTARDNVRSQWRGAGKVASIGVGMLAITLGRALTGIAAAACRQTARSLAQLPT